MPEYLSPGVYVEETSFRSKSIEGVSTTTTGFVGPCRFGPVDLPGEIVTSLVEFERVYGDGADLAPGGVARTNYLWHAARAFFAEGGKRLYVARVFSRNDDDGMVGDESNGPFLGPDANDSTAARAGSGNYLDGYARKLIDSDPATTKLVIRARYPGAQGNLRVRIRLQLGQNILLAVASERKIQGALNERDVVSVFAKPRLPTDPALSPNHTGRYRAVFNTTTGEWNFVSASGTVITLADLNPSDYEVHAVTASVAVSSLTDPSRAETFVNLGLDKARATGGQPDGLTARFAEDPTNPAPTRAMPVVIRAMNYAATPSPVEVTDGLTILATLLHGDSDLTAYVTTGAPRKDTREAVLEGGHDGELPGLGHYEGTVNAANNRKTGLKQFEDIEDISIVAAPGATAEASEDEALALCNALSAHSAHMRYRIAVLEPRKGMSVGDVRKLRGRMDSKHAALYYPWVRVIDPATRLPVHLPPAGFVAGIYARNDSERAVYKAPANEVVNLAVGFETDLNQGQQDVLNPEGVNCFRFFEGRGYRLWGARTVSSDPEWKYVNLRRYFAYLERSIDRGTQWAVFEPNGPKLWGNVRRTIEDFLFNEFQSGALLGEKPDAAYFVKCDRSTMTQSDLDNGRLVCLIGVAVVKPAEFVIFRVGQWTGDRKA